jgi:hypothetical protein
LINIDKYIIEAQKRAYYDKNLDWQTLKALLTVLTDNAARFDAAKARVKILNKEDYDQSCIQRYTIRPFDTRWCYYTSTRPLWNETRPDLHSQYWGGNIFLVTRLKTGKEAKGSPLYVSRCFVDCQSLARNVSVIPIRLRVQSVKNNKPKSRLIFWNQQARISTQRPTFL